MFRTWERKFQCSTQNGDVILYDHSLSSVISVPFFLLTPERHRMLMVVMISHHTKARLDSTWLDLRISDLFKVDKNFMLRRWFIKFDEWAFCVPWECSMLAAPLGIKRQEWWSSSWYVSLHMIISIAHPRIPLQRLLLQSLVTPRKVKVKRFYNKTNAISSWRRRQWEHKECLVTLSSYNSSPSRNVTSLHITQVICTSSLRSISLGKLWTTSDLCFEKGLTMTTSLPFTSGHRAHHVAPQDSQLSTQVWSRKINGCVKVNPNCSNPDQRRKITSVQVS